LCSRLSVTDAKHLAHACGYLPLALRISGSLLHNDPALSIATYLARLADHQQRLTHLRDPDDLQLDVAATLVLSYAQLEEPVQYVFRQLGVMVADFSTELAHAVVAVPEGTDATTSLHRLLRRNLVMYDQARDRWQLHDLVRDLARQELEQHGESEVAQWRYAQATLQIAQAIQEQYRAGGDTTLAGLAQFDAERPHIDATRRWAHLHAETPAGDQLLLDTALATHFINDLRYDPQHESIPLWEEVQMVTRRLGNRAEEGRALNYLGNAYYYLGELPKAISYQEQSLVIAREIGDRYRVSITLGNLGSLYSTLSEVHTAISYYEQSLAVAHEIGERRSEGITLGNLGIAFTELGEPSKAINYFEHALTLFRELGDRRSEGNALLNLGNTYMELGDTPRALDTWDKALIILREIGARREEGYTLSYLARTQAIQGDIMQATTTFTHALTLLQEVNDRRGAAECQWLFGQALAEYGEQEHALPLLQAALAYEQEIGHAKAAEHAALIARLEAGEKLPPKLRIPKTQQAFEDNQETSTEETAQP
jgi:tetratricopeptide (TPR) repeat protein